ncbi:MAG: ABC transporter ATP-binding protein [Actinobacteria bacterium]|nr:ABC transporter ATP-binding protein [Actinomycetota bacterium]
MTLQLANVVKHYTSGSGEVVRAVDDVTLDLDAGEMVALYGPSGSGKTTLLMLAAALLRPDRGTVRFAGRSLGDLSDREASDYRLRDVGVVFQHFELMRGVPAVENAAIKLLAEPMGIGEARRRAAPWLERVGLGHRLEAAPEQLSGGERQRVAIARALANEPRLILADEPTGSLDTQRGREVLLLLREIARERSTPVLVVTHDPQAAQIADRVHTLRDGKIEECDDAAVSFADETTSGA